MADGADGKPKVLVLGGVGFIGRNFVKYCVDNGLASKVRVVDKKLPATAYLSPDHKAAFDNGVVEFKRKANKRRVVSVVSGA